MRQFALALALLGAPCPAQGQAGGIAITGDELHSLTLGDHEGPFRVLAPADGRPARSVRQATAIRVAEIPGPL